MPHVQRYFQSNDERPLEKTSLKRNEQWHLALILRSGLRRIRSERVPGYLITQVTQYTQRPQTDHSEEERRETRHKLPQGH